MQESFEFNAPKTYNFIATPKCRQPNDFSINLSDPNDYWFMITHVEVSPNKQLEDPQQEIEDKPVIRKQIRFQQPVTQIEQPKAVLGQAEVKKRKTTRKTLPPKAIIKPPAIQKKDRKTTNIVQKVSEIISENNMKMQNDLANDDKRRTNAMQLKQSRVRNKSVGFLSKSRKEQSKYSRPCPFPPRIQREWQKGSKKDWYSLSPQSKVQAQKKMNQIKLSKQMKSIVPQKMERKEQGRFKF